MDATTREAASTIKWNWSTLGEIIQEYAGTVLVLMLIGNGLATFLIMFDKIMVSSELRHLVGGFSLIFSIAVVGWAVHKATRNH